jgi:hypothetical protein
VFCYTVPALVFVPLEVTGSSPPVITCSCFLESGVKFFRVDVFVALAVWVALFFMVFYFLVIEIKINKKRIQV